MCKHIFFVSCFLIALCASAVPPVTKCNSDDAKCAKASAKAFLPIFADGITDIGVERLDPVVFTKIDASTPNLKFLLTDITVTGLKSCEPKKVQRDVVNSKMVLKFLCTATLEGDYELGGQVLIIPIQGKGKVRAALKKSEINLFLDMIEKNGADGKPHWHIKSWSHTYELKDKSEIFFGNLFDGNEVLGAAAKELLATSSNEIVHEIGGPVIKTVVARVVKVVQGFFRTVPAEDLALN